MRKASHELDHHRVRHIHPQLQAHAQAAGQNLRQVSRCAGQARPTPTFHGRTEGNRMNPLILDAFIVASMAALGWVFLLACLILL